MLTRRTFGHSLGLGAPALLAAPALFLAGAAAQGAYPERNVALVVPWAAGGSTDAVARILAARLQQDTGKSFIVDNRTGANGTIGFSTHLATELFLNAAGVEMTDVGYRGGAPAVQGTVAGEAQMIVQAAPGVPTLIQSGDLRALAISSAQRSPVAPEIPTFKEQGFDVVVAEHIAVLVPAGTPASIVARLNEIFRAAATAPETRERLAALATVPETQRPEEWAAYNAAENARWRDVIRARNIRVQ